MHTLFTLEDIYGLKVGEIDEEICLTLDRSISAPSSYVDSMLRACEEQTVRLENGQISWKQ